MKNIILSSIYLISFAAFGQQYTDEPPKKKDKEEMKSLIGKAKDITGFGNFDFRVGKVKDKETLILGGYGGILINRNVMMGIAAYGITTTVEFESDVPNPGTPTTLKLNGGYSGLLLGAKIATKEIIHVSVPIIVGIGHMDVSNPNYFDLPGGDNDYIIESANFFMIEPGLMLEINISHHFRLGLGGSYRVAKGLDLQSVTEKDLSGFSGVVGFQFGNF